jgi:hypothetical protein
MWKKLRIAVLLFVLVVVAANAWYDQHRVHAWRQAVYVGIFPMAGDGSAVTRAYVAGLARGEYAAIPEFFSEEARRIGLALTDPVRIEVYGSPPNLPPAPPTGSMLATVWWSLKIRYYAWHYGVPPSGPRPVIRMFVVYHDPALSPSLAHSAGLEKGLIGVAHVFAVPHMRGSNDVVIAHELLHTFGATDKYDPVTDAPLFPDGYGDPAQVPRYPQRLAEVMAGRRALSASQQEMPASLDECVIGPATAAEIHWTQH